MPTGPVTLDDLLFLPLDKATALPLPPEGQLYHYRARWWVMHPEYELVFYSRGGRYPLISPQCNGKESIAEKLRTSLGYDKLGMELLFVESVLVPVDPEGLVKKSWLYAYPEDVA